MKKLKKIPKFSSEAQEREFWQRVDSTEYVDYSNAKHWSFPNLKLSTQPITIRLRNETIKKIKTKAKKMDTSYQDLIQQWVSEAVAK